MSTAVMETTVSQITLYARLLEAALHQPFAWTATANGNPLGQVEVQTSDSGEMVEATFTAGPVPQGESTIVLSLDQIPVHVGVTVFEEDGMFWQHRVVARLRR